MQWSSSQLRLVEKATSRQRLGFALRPAKRLSQGPLFFGEDANQSALKLPAACLVLEDKAGAEVSWEDVCSHLPEATRESCLSGRVYTQDNEHPIAWFPCDTAAEARSIQEAADLRAGVYIAASEEVYALGQGSPHLYIHPLPRIVLSPQDRAADNTDFTQSMAHLLQAFVHRFTSLPDKALPHIAIATGYLYSQGLNSLLALLSNPKIEKLRLLFSGKADKHIIALMEDYFLAPLDEREEPESAQVFYEAMEAGRLEVMVYPHAFLHAKLFLGWEFIDDLHFPHGAAVVGSSNITGAGLHHTGNLELNVYLEDKHTLLPLKQWFEARWEEGEEPQPQLMEALEARRQQHPPPSFQVPGLLEVWRAGRRKQMTTADEYLNFLARLYRQRIGLTRIDLEQPPFPHDDVRQIKPAPEQESGVLALAQRLLQLRFAFLADSVGLGKTITSLGVAWYLYRLQESQQAVVIAPGKLIKQWESDRKKLRMPEGIVTYLNRHVLERKSEKEALEALAPYDLILVEEAHQTLRSRKNKLWSHLRAHLRRELSTRLLLISATPWNNTREDIFNYICLAWHDGLALANQFPISLLQPIRRHMEYFVGRAGPAARTFLSLPLPEYRAIFGETFVQRTRHRIAKLYQSHNDFPTRNIQPYPLNASPAHDQFFQQLEHALERLFISYREPFRALQRAAAATISDLPEELADVPDSNLHRSFMIQLYKRAESSILALAISIANVVRRLEEFETTLVDLVINSEAPCDALQEWMEAQYLRLQHDISTKGELTSLEEDLLSPAEKARFGSLKQLFQNLDDESVKRAVQHIIEHEVAQDHQELIGLQKQLGLALEVSSPKGLLATEVLRMCHEKQRKLILVAGFTDTAVGAFIHAINAAPEARIGLAIGGNEGWLYDPKEHRPVAFSQEDWDAALTAKDAPERRKALLETRKRAASIKRQKLIAAFSPKAQQTKATQLEQMGGEIDFLIGSEAISVGQNLQDATALFQLDLPWNPMIIEQRIGRIDRRGGGRPKDPQDPNSPKIVDVYYCWSHAAIENEIALRDKLKTKAAGAMQDTRFDELLLYELRDKIEALRSASGEFPAETDQREELAEFLKQRQAEMLQKRTMPEDVTEEVGASMEGVRHLAVWTEEQQVDLDQPPQPVIASGIASTQGGSPPTWHITLALQPKNELEKPLGPTLYESIVYTHNATQLPQPDLEAVVLSLLDATQTQRHRLGPALHPEAWSQAALRLEQHILSFAADYLEQHNLRIQQKAALPAKPLDPTAKFRIACDKARKAIQAELKNNSFYKTPPGKELLTSIGERLRFLLLQLKTDVCHRLLQDSSERDLGVILQLVITLPRQTLQEEFDVAFIALVGPLWGEKQDAVHGSSEILPAVQLELGQDQHQYDVTREAELAAVGRWHDIDVSLVAAAFTS